MPTVTGSSVLPDRLQWLTRNPMATSFQEPVFVREDVDGGVHVRGLRTVSVAR